MTMWRDQTADGARYAYVEFADPTIVQNALVLNESMFRGRLLSVCPLEPHFPGVHLNYQNCADMAPSPAPPPIM